MRKPQRSYFGPLPHIIVRGSQKQLHGWYPGKRECTAERMLINPYNGCTHNCPFCYAHAFRGYFELFRKENLVAVFEDFDQAVALQLDSLDIASCGYLSPVTDPFQPINNKYRLSEKIIKTFVERNIPIEFITKGRVSDEVIELLQKQKHSFGQVSILTLDEELRKRLTPGGVSTKELIDNLQRLSRAGVYAVLRIDPIVPLITDSQENLSRLVAVASSTGVSHIIASCLDIPWKIKEQTIKSLSTINPKVKREYHKLYQENIGYLNAATCYRKNIFSNLKTLCQKYGLSFALCMEYELIQGKPQGLNKKFMTSRNCEGKDIPIYIREGKQFEPAADCSGACLACTSARCGIEDLAMGKPRSKKAWGLEDYRRWGRQVQKSRQKSLFKVKS